jgi:hypothetical protein
MSLNMKISLLALVGVAAAVPHYGQHSKFHHKSSGGYAGPTDGWTGQNSTVAGPTGTGVAPGPGDESTTEITTTQTSKATLTQTIYVTPVPVDGEPTSVAAVDVGLSTGPSVCGPATVTITATNKVTVTVPAGGAGSSAVSPHPEAPTSVVEASTPGYGAPVPVPSSSSAVEEVKPTYEATPTKEAAVPTYDNPAPPKSTEEVTSSSSKEVEPSHTAPAEVTPTSSAESSASETSKYSSATPSSMPTHAPSSGGKRGILYRWDGFTAAKGLAGVGNFGWAANWEAKPMGDIGSIEFIPTLRVLKDAPTWPALLETALGPGGSKVCFTFNEPDKADQAALSPEVACTAWKDNVNKFKNDYPGVNFVGPSVSNSEKANEGLAWLASFDSVCSDAGITTNNFHWYGPPTGSWGGFAGFKSYIEQAHAQTGKDFYVGEFGLREASGEDSAAFLKEALPYLDSHPNCVGYSYFAAGAFITDKLYDMTNDNLLGTAESLTPAGKVYCDAA